MKKIILLTASLYLGFCIKTSAQTDYKTNRQKQNNEQNNEDVKPSKKINTEPLKKKYF